MAGLLTILLYFWLLFCMLLHHPEEANCAGHNSGVHIGEQLLKKGFSSAFSWIGFRVAGNKWAPVHVGYV